MNRSERRRAAKHGTVQGAQPTMTFDKFVYYFSLAMADALHCEYNMNGEEVAKLFKKANMTAECLKEDYIRLRDIETMCLEELGIEFVESMKGR